MPPIGLELEYMPRVHAVSVVLLQSSLQGLLAETLLYLIV